MLRKLGPLGSSTAPIARLGEGLADTGDFSLDTVIVTSVDVSPALVSESDGCSWFNAVMGGAGGSASGQLSREALSGFDGTASCTPMLPLMSQCDGDAARFPELSVAPRRGARGQDAVGGLVCRSQPGNRPRGPLVWPDARPERDGDGSGSTRRRAHGPPTGTRWSGGSGSMGGSEPADSRSWDEFPQTFFFPILGPAYFWAAAVTASTPWSQQAVGPEAQTSARSLAPRNAAGLDPRQSGKTDRMKSQII